MASARLHIICGNCGCNDMLEFKIDPEGHDVSQNEPQFEPAVFISCKNCATIHDLSDTIVDKTGSPEQSQTPR
jgi:hypothetical protein